MVFLFSEPQQFISEIKRAFNFSNCYPCLRVCVTEKCNQNCFYCHKEGMQNENYAAALTLEEYTFIAKAFRDIGLTKAKFSGGEPLLNQDLCEIIKVFKKTGFEDISLITNGSLLTENKLRMLKEAGLNRITISINTLKKKIAKQISNSDSIEQVLQNAVSARNFFETVKINCLILPNINFPDEVLDIANFCRDNHLILKVLSGLSDEAPYPLSNQALNIIKLYKRLTKKETNENSFVPSNRYFFSDGTIVEINDFKNEEYQKRMSASQNCQNCLYKTQCVEGPYAIRIMPNGDVLPCLIRKDNLIKFKKIKKSNAKLICLTGLASSGKSTFREFALKKFNIKSVYLGKILKKEVANQNKPVTYENVMEVSKSIFEEEGPLGVITKSFQVIENELANETAVIIDAVRSPEEYAFLSQFFKSYLVGVICSKKERFKRAKKGDFKLTTKQLIRRDKLEMGEIQTNPKLNVGELLGQADYYISGEAKDFEQKAQEILRGILND